ncbi:MAG TPA: hypothetical protein VNL94_00980 [Candidatus Binatia bacterium]|nr:hypothetical protein [Candidatus Binatia bacterium]
MFATLLGALPDPPGARLEDRIEAAVRAQEAAGFEPVTDGRLRLPRAGRPERAWDRVPDPAEVVAAWLFIASTTDRAAKQALPGPYSAARRFGLDPHDAAMRLREVVEALAEAGCPIVEIEETEAHRIGADEAERERFREAHRRLAEGISPHLTLSIVGGSAWDAGLETIVEPPYASLAVDVIAGADNWNLVTRLPGERGVIVGALPAGDSPADAREMLLFAARHAAAARGRGLARVGLGSAGSWAGLTWDQAVRKMERLGDAARLATMRGEALARSIDPRAVDARSAALGQVTPRRSRRHSRGAPD